MPYVSSPVAYPPSSSPPQSFANFPESRKRSSGEKQSSPSKKRILPGREQLDGPTLTPLEDALSLERQLDANKENIFPRRLPGQTIGDPKDFHPELLNGANEETDFGELFCGSILPGRGIKLGGIGRLNCRTSSIEKLPQIRTSQGDILTIRSKKKAPCPSSYSLFEQKPIHAPAQAERTFYGVDVHNLLQQVENQKEAMVPADDCVPVRGAQPSLGISNGNRTLERGHRMLWTEKYRARKFADLIGDDRTHREVLRWLKGWDPIVFPSSSKAKRVRKVPNEEQEPQDQAKILLLTGCPGLGKTTLAHVCARQAGYEVLEINASEERSRDTVKGKIRDCVGTENVKGVNMQGDGVESRKKGRPFCVIVDEVDGVVSGGSSGDGGFIKALVDLLMLDKKNSSAVSTTSNDFSRAGKKGDRFRLLRPIILICNDVYHPSLRLLRAMSIAEIIHIRKPPLDKVVARIGCVLDQEGILYEKDGVRRLCEAAWGLQKSQRERISRSSGAAEGDMRCVLVAAEWAVSKLKQHEGSSPKLTKKWIEDNVIESLSQRGGGVRGIGRGNTREIVERVFLDGAGFANSELLATTQSDTPSLGSSDIRRLPQTAKRTSMQKLQEIVDTSGESDHIVTDCFATYPSHQFQDDTFLSKPNAAYDWLYFHDRLSSKVHSGQEWDLKGYLSQSTLGLHHLFASPAKPFAGGDKRQRNENLERTAIFMGAKPEFEVSEVTKENEAILQSFQSSFSAPLLRVVGSGSKLSTDFLPSVLKMLKPDVRPVIVGGNNAQRGVVSVRKDSERRMIQRAVSVMSAIGVSFQQIRLDFGQVGMGKYIYRMEPPLDILTTYQTASHSEPATATRYAVCQALDQEHRKYQIQRNDDIRQHRYDAGGADRTSRPEQDAVLQDSRTKIQKGEENAVTGGNEAPKRDFFGRMVNSHVPQSANKTDALSHRSASKSEPLTKQARVWVTFNEGFSNAVRKPITLAELLQGF